MDRLRAFARTFLQLARATLGNHMSGPRLLVKLERARVLGQQRLGRKVRVHGAAPLATAKEAERVFATANKNVRVRSCFGQNKNVIASLAKDVKTRPSPG